MPSDHSPPQPLLRNVFQPAVLLVSNAERVHQGQSTGFARLAESRSQSTQ